LVFPAWSAVIVHEPTATVVNTPVEALIVQTDAVVEAYAIARPDEAEAEMVGLVPKTLLPGALNVIVWLACVILNVWLAGVAAV
jgi:hypothetical protein